MTGKDLMEIVGATFGLFIAGALLVMLGAFLIGMGPIGWVILVVLLLSK